MLRKLQRKQWAEQKKAGRIRTYGKPTDIKYNVAVDRVEGVIAVRVSAGEHVKYFSAKETSRGQTNKAEFVAAMENTLDELGYEFAKQVRRVNLVPGTWQYEGESSRGPQPWRRKRYPDPYRIDPEEPDAEKSGGSFVGERTGGQGTVEPEAKSDEQRNAESEEWPCGDECVECDTCDVIEDAPAGHRHG